MLLLRSSAKFIPIAAGSLLAGTLYSQSRSRILNDAPVAEYSPRTQIVEDAHRVRSGKVYTDKGITRFNGKLDYHQLTYGSFAGLISGFLFGKVSKVLVTLILGGLVTAEYLQYTGQLSINPWAQNVYNWGVRNLDQEILIKDPSFKASFTLAFLVAAFNS